MIKTRKDAVDLAMNSFEKTLKISGMYTRGGFDRAGTKEIECDDGRIGKYYLSQNYYNNGETNNLFKVFMMGRSFGRLEAINEESS